MNHTLVAAERHIADIEGRIARQSALIEERARSGLDTQHAARALRTLEQALDRTRVQNRILLPPAPSAVIEAKPAPRVPPARQEKAPQQHEAADPLAPWETPPMRIAQLAWGEGCSNPGGTGYLLELVNSLDLDSTKSVVEFGIGLGAGSRAIHRTFGAQVTGYEVAPDLARAARQLSVLARLEKSVDCLGYHPQDFALHPASHDCILSTETIYRIERKEDLLIKLELGLKPRGRIVMTDFVLCGENAANDTRLKALAPGAAAFWPAARYARFFRERNFDLQASDDVTAAYRKLVIEGCKRLAEGGPERIANAKAYPEATLAFLDVYARRVAALDVGLLKVMRFLAVKRSGPKLMSDW